MSNIIDFDSYREKKDIDYAVDMINRKKGPYRLSKKTNNYKKAYGIKDIKYTALGICSIIGEIVCVTKFTDILIKGNFREDSFVNGTGVLWMIILPSLFFSYKEEILESFKKLFNKFKESNKKVTEEEFKVMYADIQSINLKELEETEKLRKMGFTDLSNPFIRDFLEDEDKPKRR